MKGNYHKWSRTPGWVTWEPITLILDKTLITFPSTTPTGFWKATEAIAEAEYKPMPGMRLFNSSTVWGTEPFNFSITILAPSCKFLALE